jgi:hypothetical protein
VKASAKPKTATEPDADEFVRAVKRLLKVYRDNTPKTDESFAYTSSLRTLRRCVRGLEEAKSGFELAAEMKLAMDLLLELQVVGFHAAKDTILLDEPDPEGHMARATELMELIEELEAIHNRQRD